MKKLILLFACTFLLMAEGSADEPYRAGDYASDFNLRNTEGNMVSLSGLADAKGIILVFTCNTCPVSKKYEQRIMDLDGEFREKGYPVIAVNSNDRNVSPGDSFEEMKKLAESKKYSFDYLYDESQEVAREYGATNTPHVYVISKSDDKMVVEYVGAIDNNADDASKASIHYVKDAVNALLKGEPVPVAGTKAIGCGIKWSKS